jgi:molecular chaperone GrpE
MTGQKKDTDTFQDEGKMMGEEIVLPDEGSLEIVSEEVLFESAKSNPKQVLITDVELKNMQKELMEYKEKYLRVLADGENARKRMQKESQEKIKYAVENVIVDFLHPLDNLENALKFAQNMSEEVKNWAFGFQMILTQFKDLLTENGVQPIESVGSQFDPHRHEAVETAESDKYPNGTVLEEYVRGYKIGDRTIRPARVKVAKAPGDNESPLDSSELDEPNI